MEPPYWYAPQRLAGYHEPERFTSSNSTSSIGCVCSSLVSSFQRECSLSMVRLPCIYSAGRCPASQAACLLRDPSLCAEGNKLGVRLNCRPEAAGGAIRTVAIPGSSR